MRRRLVLLSFAGITVGSGCTALLEASEEEDDQGEQVDTTDDTSVTFGEIIRFDDSYAIEMVIEEEEVEGLLILRVDGENFLQQFHDESGQDSFEFYSVDGDTYLVIDDMCYFDPSGQEVPEGPDPAAIDEDIDPNLEAIGTTEIDGTTVYRFDVIDSELDSSIAYYVEKESGYLRRVESDDLIVDFHSWGDIAAIEKPDLECYEIEDFPENEIADLPEDTVAED